MLLQDLIRTAYDSHDTYIPQKDKSIKEEVYAVRFPDFNIGYVFGYKSDITSEGFLITFLGGIVRIQFKFKDIAKIHKETYHGGRISWDVIRWGKCPPGKDAIKIVLKNNTFENHMIVFDNLDAAIDKLKKQGQNIISS